MTLQRDAGRRPAISASRRTDVPAFYAAWFMNRVRAGFCMARTPFGVTHRVELAPDRVAGFVFWTRDAAPLLPHLPELDDRGYAYYFLYTLTGYPRSLEPRAPPVESAVATMAALAGRIGPDRVVWRYDPLLLDRELDERFHLENFRRIARRLEGVSRRAIVSVIDRYRRFGRNLGVRADAIRYDVESYRTLLDGLAAVADAAGMRMQTCAEPGSAGEVRYRPGGCVEHTLLRGGGEPPSLDRAGPDSPVSPRGRRLRPHCLCEAGVDLGVNDTCGFGCAYCYATRDPARALEACRRHDPGWNSLVGDLAARR